MTMMEERRSMIHDGGGCTRQAADDYRIGIVE